MQRYFVERIDESTLKLDGDDARHLSAVMRAKPGDEFIACDGKGRDVLASVEEIGKDFVKAAVVRELTDSAEMAWEVTVAQSLPKGDKLETVIQKGTEAGAIAFVPFLSHRTVVQYDERKEAKRLERWRKIAKEAAEQSHRSALPDVEAVSSWKALLARIPEFDLALLCYEEEGRAGTGLKPMLQTFKEAAKAERPRVLILVGPEGGFTPQEAEEAAAKGAKPVGLGRRILRTETAALYALACIAYESGELGGT
jgi:16S rRNA (uracil1498-N3)-methyltransferase